jgi:methylmalonyl-CoA mutase cobalamin-binding subunit
MKILHVLNDGPQATADEIIAAQSSDHDVEVIDLSGEGVSHDALIDAIFASDRVVSW